MAQQRHGDRAHLTPATIPYWELRTHSELTTGVEKPFPDSHKEGSFGCLLIAADKVGW